MIILKSKLVNSCRSTVLIARESLSCISYINVKYLGILITNIAPDDYKYYQKNRNNNNTFSKAP